MLPPRYHDVWRFIRMDDCPESQSRKIKRARRWEDRPRALRLLVWLLLLPLKILLMVNFSLFMVMLVSYFIPFFLFAWMVFDAYGMGYGFLMLLGVPAIVGGLLAAKAVLDETDPWEFPY
ncbi:MAG TPA: hypothetical protein DEB24_05055 [Coriobacteriia bacterium]|nr:hypothetical protein [Coriobacteriia bacterium]